MVGKGHIAQILFAMALPFCASLASAAMSWYDAVWALASGSSTLSQKSNGMAGSGNDGAKMRQAAETVVAEYEKIGAGEIAQQCIDASRIVEIAEQPTGLREMAFLLASIISLFLALMVTYFLANMFKVEIAKLLWLPIGGVLLLLGVAWQSYKAAKKRKFAIAAGVALSATGVISVVDPVRHAFFDLVASIFLGFTSFYVPFASAAIGLIGILFLAIFLFKNLGGGMFAKIAQWLLRNSIGFVVIPLVCAFSFLGILSIVGPWIDAKVASKSGADLPDYSLPDTSVPFSSYPNDVRVAVGEMARAAEIVYDGQLPKGVEVWNDYLFGGALADVQSWKWRNGVMTTPSGTELQVYRRNTGTGDGEIAVIFRGTASLKDGMADLKQLFGDESEAQYEEAAAIVRAVRKSTDLPVVVLGHSLGGGQAQYAVAQNVELGGIRGVGFNPAGLSARSVKAIERICGSATAAARSFANVRIDNDPISTVGVLLGQVVNVPSRGSKGIESHRMGTLAREIERGTK